MSPEQVAAQAAPAPEPIVGFPAAPASPSADAIAQQALIFNFAAGLFGVVAVVALIMGIVEFSNDKDSAGAWTAFFSAGGVAIWLYLVAQIVHIRALLARK